MSPSQSDPNHDARIVELLTECQLPLMLYVRSLLPGDAGSQDVAQQTNVRIWEKRHEFTLGSNFRAWAFAIARFEVLNYRKLQARNARMTFSEELENTFAEEIQTQHDDLASRHEALQACLESMKPESREMLMQRYASSESLAEFAARVGRSLGGIKVSLHRLRSMLAECIERKLVSGESR